MDFFGSPEISELHHGIFELDFLWTPRDPAYVAVKAVVGWRGALSSQLDRSRTTWTDDPNSDTSHSPLRPIVNIGIAIPAPPTVDKLDNLSISHASIKSS